MKMSLASCIILIVIEIKAKMGCTQVKHKPPTTTVLATKPVSQVAAPEPEPEPVPKLSAQE